MAVRNSKDSDSALKDPHVHNRWPLAREGFPFLFMGLGVTSISLYFGIYPASVLFGILSAFVAFFFRDPDRKGTSDPKAVLTPADGKIIEIRRETDSANPLGEPALKVSIFMSLFSVHVNRIPAWGEVAKVVYHPGDFFAANLDKASERNENNRVTLRTPDSRKIVLIQIAGLIARRIACWIREGDRVEAGQRFGLIRFGSRVELLLPEDTRIIMQVGAKVKAGETIIGYLS